MDFSRHDMGSIAGFAAFELERGLLYPVNEYGAVKELATRIKALFREEESYALIRGMPILHALLDSRRETGGQIDNLKYLALLSAQELADASRLPDERKKILQEYCLQISKNSARIDESSLENLARALTPGIKSA